MIAAQQQRGILRLALLGLASALAWAVSGCADPLAPPAAPPAIEAPPPRLDIVILCPARVSYWVLQLDGDDALLGPGAFAFGMFGLRERDSLTLEAPITPLAPAVHRLSWAEWDGWNLGWGGAPLGNSGTMETDAQGRGRIELRCR